MCVCVCWKGACSLSLSHGVSFRMGVRIAGTAATCLLHGGGGDTCFLPVSHSFVCLCHCLSAAMCIFFVRMVNGCVLSVFFLLVVCVYVDIYVSTYINVCVCVLYV